MAEVFGERRKRLLRYLLRTKTGAAVDELAAALGVTRTAVRQHLGALMRDGLVAPGSSRPSGGRPQKLYVPTGKAKEAFPRHYSWFAQLLVQEITKEHGATGLRARLGRIASTVVAQLRRNGSTRNASSRERIETLSVVMDELGYDARVGKEPGAATIEADNCVFHELAMKHPEICHFDLALVSGYTGHKAELHECMARGGRVCRFRFTPRT